MKRSCPDCGVERTYTLVGDFNRANRLNTCCQSCSQQKRAGADYSVNKQTGCWEWNRRLINGGYGVKRYKGKFYLAHRLYYERGHGSIPDGLEIDHLCRNRKCVNPTHLEAVTKSINQRRGLKSRIREQQAKEIKQIGSSMKQRDVAKKFGVSQRLIWNILHQLTWKDI